MNDSILLFQEDFPKLLKQEAETVLNSEVSIGNRFESADSFSYLLKTKLESYVGKIYRFKDSPPKGKLELIEKLLHKHHILHEELVYRTYTGSIFKFGWSITKFIPGGTAKSLRDEGMIGDEEYYTKLSILLKKIHQIKFNRFGSLIYKNQQTINYSEFLRMELQSKDFHDIKSKYLNAFNLIQKAKDWIIKNMNNYKWNEASLVHDDIHYSNIIWDKGNLVLID